MTVHMYDHGTVSFRASEGFDSPFTCNWDSGIVGFIFTTEEKILETGVQEEHIRTALLQDLKEYDQYINGEVYQYRILNDDGDVVDSCGGFYSEKDAEDEAKSLIASLEKV